MSNKTISIIALVAILALLVSAAAGTMVNQEVEIRGSVVNGSTTYDYTSFAGFWYDLDDDQHSETMAITVDVGNRSIDEDDIVYTCTKQLIFYENDDLNDTYGGYDIIGFMAEKYICYDGNTDELVKLLVEWDSSDDLTLSMDEPMELPEGYMLTVREIDLDGGKCVLELFKDGDSLDMEIVEGGNPYMYEDDDDVLVFGLTVDSVFRGTDSNLVTVGGIFLRSEDILEVDTGEDFGIMEVTSTNANTIVLENDETVDLGEDDEVEIMDGLYFKVADSSALRYYLAKTISLECPECPTCPECTENETVIEVAEETTEAVPEDTAEDVVDVAPVATTEDTPDETVDDEETSDGTLPGFEAVFAIAGLLAVAYLVLRQRE